MSLLRELRKRSSKCRSRTPAAISSRCFHRLRPPSPDDPPPGGGLASTGLPGLGRLIHRYQGLWTFYTQLRAQQVLSPSHTALIFTLEPVFAALTSFVVLGERLGTLQWAGAALILAAMALPALERST
ncbi:MAG: DMT family transporter [Gemmatimonadales bacterium]